MPSFKMRTHSGCQMRSYYVDGAHVEREVYLEARDACQTMDCWRTVGVGEGSGTHRDCSLYDHTAEGR